MATDRNLLQFKRRADQTDLYIHDNSGDQRTKNRKQALRENEQNYIPILEDIEEGYFETDLAGKSDIFR